MTAPQPTNSLFVTLYGSVESQVVETWKQLKMFGQAHHVNIFNGLSVFQVFSSGLPDTTELEPGQIALGFDDPTWKLCTNINGAIYTVDLTAV